jgi:hypothetical protein
VGGRTAELFRDILRARALSWAIASISSTVDLFRNLFSMATWLSGHRLASH